MKLGTFIAWCGALQATLAAMPPALAQGAPAVPFGIGDAVRVQHQHDAINQRRGIEDIDGASKRETPG